MSEGLYTGPTEDTLRPVVKKEEVIYEAHPDKKRQTYSFDEALDYFQKGKEIADHFEIGQREATWIPRAEFPDLPIALLLASDIHFGSIRVDYEMLKQHLDIVENTPNFFIATNGDHADMFNAANGKIATGMTEDPLPPQIQARTFMEKFIELDRKSKVAVMSHGNHDDFGFVGGQDFYDSFLGEMSCPIFTTGGILNVMVEGQLYRIVMNHTYWGKSKLNVTNAAKRLIEYEGGGDVDIGWVGHTHQSSYEHFERGMKDIIAVVSGTYKIDDYYAAKKGIGGRGQRPGICVMLWPGERRMQAFKDVEVAHDYLKALIFLKEEKGKCK